jgi:hypothetical protein
MGRLPHDWRLRRRRAPRRGGGRAAWRTGPHPPGSRRRSSYRCARHVFHRLAEAQVDPEGQGGHQLGQSHPGRIAPATAVHGVDATRRSTPEDRGSMTAWMTRAAEAALMYPACAQLPGTPKGLGKQPAHPVSIRGPQIRTSAPVSPERFADREHPAPSNRPRPIACRQYQ